MTNKEKYAEDLCDILLNSFGVDKENKPFRCVESCSGQCQFYNDEIACKTLAKQWLDEEYKTDWSKVPVDTPILVKDGPYKWLHRHFAKYENGKVFAWVKGLTSWSAGGNLCVDWECARLCEDNK
uniref:Uncharacterized protein n=1 Tax=virus sp. ctLTC15 TaxID=2826801 RepID=A0A8S5R8S8_9VIRU|nr:MAG TPA: hypothetical protein [virus sp. ctLTC15]